MQSTSSQFELLAKSAVRPIKAEVRVSFDKQIDPSITFFTLDQSLLDGPDILADDNHNVITEWDKYLYRDYSDRIISVEVNREELEPYSVVQAYADVTFDNFDGYFTPNSNSPIGQYILPRRPFRILGGFGNEVIPQFVGLSTEMPEIDRQNGTARFHLIDFLTFIFSKEIGDTVMLLNASTGDVLDYLFQHVGLTTNQYVLDETSFNRIPFFYAEKGQNLGDIIKELIRAEQGRLFMDELGIIRYLSRQSFNDTSVYTFNEWDVEDYQPSDESDIINYAKVIADVLEEQVESSIWESAERILVKAGESTVVWASFEDPITNITTPVYSAEPVESSHFTSYEDVDQTIPTTSITITDIDKFAKAAKITFTNGAATDGYITAIDIWGTPVRISETIEVIHSDQDSIDKFEEQRYEYRTQYIQKRSSAITEATIMVDDYKDYGSIVKGRFIGNVALQIGDVVTLDNVDGYNEEFTITSISNIWSDFRYRQDLELKQKDIRTYFILSSDSVAKSLLNGADVLAP